MLKLKQRSTAVEEWRVFWVPQDGLRGDRRPALEMEWQDLRAREDAIGVLAGDPIFLAPDYQVDPLLSLYGQSDVFRGYTAETKRNYATDVVLLLNALWARGLSWTQMTSQDLKNYKHWRRSAAANPRRIEGAKWDRELAAFASLFKWARREGHVTRSPIQMKEVSGRNGEKLTVPEDRSGDAKASNVHWLTPRTWTLWTNVGLRGFTRDGVPEKGWVGRLEDRNVAFVGALRSSGMRLTENASLLTFEVPRRPMNRGRYCRGKLAAQVTRSKKARTYYIASDVIGDIEAYEDSSRAWVVRKAQRAGRYDRLPGMRLVTEVSRGLKPIVRWSDRKGVMGEEKLDKLTWQERTLLFTEGPHGPEPLWLWLNERGLPFHPHSWEGVFRTANKRCERVLTPPLHLRLDPHKVYSPTRLRIPGAIRLLCTCWWC
ncbi:site-specific integrase [Streptomyces nojiriensis]